MNIDNFKTFHKNRVKFLNFNLFSGSLQLPRSEFDGKRAWNLIN